ncbi:MAG: anaerobic ribonucleoside-triphosphate reductase activating protein [Syntrophaceae bacterium]|nr:anaerobic ribonucleoside-triphosphate reductase activating protein [Syntrophaceae bacterium]
MLNIGGFHKVSLIDYPGLISAIVFLQGCNFRCPYCHNPELVNPKLYSPSIPEETVIAFLEKRQGKIDAVTITGGEPTLQERLPEFIRRVRSLGFKIKLDTNGSFSGVLQTLIEEKLVDYLAMDIKGPLHRYDRVCRVNVEKQEIENSIRLILGAPVDYEFRTTLVKDLLTREDISAMGELVRGARLFILQNFVPSKTLDDHFLSREAPPPDELDWIKNEMSRFVDRVSVRT